LPPGLSWFAFFSLCAGLAALALGRRCARGPGFPRQSLLAALALESLRPRFAALRGGYNTSAISNGDAARLAETGEMEIKAAKRLLRFGTAEQIQQVRDGKVTARKVIQAINFPRRNQGSKNVIARAHRIQADRKAEGLRLRTEKAQMRAATWDQLRSALVNLRGLHRAADVIDEVIKIANVRQIIHETLGPALKKLEELHHEWQKRRADSAAQAARRNHRHDAGDGKRSAQTK
jgi:hypothetical protein